MTALDPWRRGLAHDDLPAVRRLFAEARAADRRGPEPGDVPGPDAEALAARQDGELVGLAWRTGDDPAELVVHPEFRRRGYGRQLAEATLARGGVWAHGTLPAAAALAGSLGASPVRTMLQLRRALPAPFPVRLPDGVGIRTFVPGRDEEQFLAVNARAFAWHPEQGRLDRAGLAESMAEAWFDPQGFFLAVRGGGAGGGDDSGGAGGGDDSGGDGDAVLGFHWTKVHPRDPTPPAGASEPIGEVYVLGVDPDSPVRGLGTPLTVAGLQHLAGLALSTVMLYVESDNAPALRLYRKLGFTDYAVDTVFARS